MPVDKNQRQRINIIDDLLTRKTYPSMEKLKAKCGGVHRNTIQKDFFDIATDHNAEIKYNKHKRGYYYIPEDFSIRGLGLHSSEKEALVVSSIFLNKIKGTEIHKQFQSSLNKVLSGAGVKDIIDKVGSSIIQPHEAVNNTGVKWMGEILNCILYSQKALQIFYRDYQRKAEKIDVSPYILKEYRNLWYIIGYNHSSKIIEYFALDRILDITPGKENYFKEPDFNESSYFENSIGRSVEGPVEKVVLEFDNFQKNYLEVHELHKSQKIISNLKDKLVIELTVHVNHELLQLIFSFREHVKVLQPKSLKAEVKNTLTQMLKKY